MEIPQHNSEALYASCCKVSSTIHPCLPYVDNYQSVYGGSLKDKALKLVEQELSKDLGYLDYKATLSSVSNSVGPPPKPLDAIDLSKYSLPDSDSFSEALLPDIEEHLKSCVLRKGPNKNDNNNNNNNMEAREISTPVCNCPALTNRRNRVADLVRRAAILYEYQSRRLAHLEALSKHGSVAWLASLHQCQSFVEYIENYNEMMKNSLVELNRTRKEEQTTAGIQIDRCRNRYFEFIQSNIDRLVEIYETNVYLRSIRQPSSTFTPNIDYETY